MATHFYSRNHVKYTSNMSLSVLAVWFYAFNDATSPHVYTRTSSSFCRIL